MVAASDQAMMTNRDIQLVKRTWKLFRGINPVLVGETFYSKLFMDHPELRSFFPRNMDEQYRKFVEVVNMIVVRLSNDEELAAGLKPLLAEQSVKKEHYEIMGKTMFWTLRQGLGGDWTEDVSLAWAHCYELVSGIITREDVSRN